ncbi:MAG: MltA domain-containing protein [Oscillatoria sp. PMC 1051.18]|nr:MltA domain-containing protein [Oscillatoria sp. PMC 1050.18]MEC5029436.1 MltA domain-containing protein [Oscillatoria sp. PMC 1051.18]
MKKKLAYCQVGAAIASSLILFSGCQKTQKSLSIVSVTPEIEQLLTVGWKADARTVLQPLASPPDELGWDEKIGNRDEIFGDKEILLQAIARSLEYLNSPQAKAAYRNYPIPEITQARVIRSLKRFQELLLIANSGEELMSAVKREFVFYQSVGSDNLGTVLFSAYFEPIYPASRTPTAEYRYPLYRLPPDLKSWSKPHPTREELEGKNGLLGAKSRLAGLELFWLKSRWEAYLIHIQGSARLILPDGKQTTIGYAGNTARDYNSIGWELVQEGKIPLEELTMPRILEYFQVNPGAMDEYISRDRSFVFFEEKYGVSALGSINVPLSAERAIATDKSLMPPGALALIQASIPDYNSSGTLEERQITRFVLDQDAGGAIKGAGRVDYFLGSGEQAGERAGVTRSYGQLYYLLLRSESL